jgi:hypothetical protein
MKIVTIRMFAVLATLLATAGAASAQSGMTSEQVQRRYQVRVMEGVLVGAAQHGAQLLAIKVQQIDPSIVLISGNPPRALGLVLDGHGLVFYIEIPGINPAISWAMRNRSRDQVAEAALLAWKRHLQELPANDQSRADLELHTRRIEQRLLPPGAASQPRQGAMPVNGTAAPPNSFAPIPRMEDPEAEYERLVTDQLVNAMLDYSQQLGLGADEWLTVAARGSQGPLETVNDGLVTITLRIKGSDLADFRAGRITRDEARARIVVREF